jgi:hypothetical protein
MFVRWISRLYVTPEADDTQQTAWSAVLVESRRVNGKPRQRHIAYLGGINDAGIRHLGSRCEFWEQVIAAFHRLGNQVAREDCKRFQAAIAAKVRRPTAEQQRAFARKRARRERERKALEEALRPWRGNLPGIKRVLDEFKRSESDE